MQREVVWDEARAVMYVGTDAVVCCCLRLHQEDKYEVPFIWLYRRDELQTRVLHRYHLWRIASLDEQWERLQKRRTYAAARVDRMLALQVRRVHLSRTQNGVGGSYATRMCDETCSFGLCRAVRRRMRVPYRGPSRT